MATRRERVVLELQDDFSPGMARAAASTILFKRALNDLDGEAVKVDRALKGTTTSGSGVSREFDKGRASIDQFSGRLGLAARALAAFGPAALPIGAVAVPAITAMSSALGAVVLAGGTAVLAFQGVGTALDKLNTAQLDPTAEHIKAAELAFEEISPSAARFVLELDKAGSAFDVLKEAAGADLFPGLTAGLEGALTQLPRARELLERVGGAVGNLGKMTGESLSGGQWNDFLDFLTREAPPAIEQLGRTVGNLAGGVADLWMAFAPLNGNVFDFFERGSQAFQNWADGLAATDGFEEFVSYLQTSGPQVADALVAVGNAFVQIAEAAAPIGGPVLQIVESLADAIATIADSPIGTPLFGLVAAMSALSLATGAYQKIQGATFGSAGAAKFKTSVSGLFEVTSAQDRARLSASKLARVEAERTAANRAAFGAVGRQAALLGGLALASSGLADKVGLSNTMSLALAGSLAGPWGTAVGGAVGLAKDFTSANDGAERALQQLEAAASETANLGRLSSALSDARSASDALAASTGTLGKALTPGGFAANLDVLFGGYETSLLGKTDAAANATEERLGDLSLAARLFGEELGTISTTGTITLGDLTSSLTAAQPALNALGISADDLVSAVRDGSINDLVDRVGDWQTAADSATGRTQTLAEAFAALNNDLVSTKTGADQVKAALDALLSPQLDLAQATDQYRAGLRDIIESLDKTGRSLVGNTKAADTNREAIRKQVTNVQSLVNAQAASGASGEKLARTMRNGRRDILAAGEAAGLSRGQVRDYLNTLGLTPKSIKTLLQADTSQAEANISALGRNLNNLKNKTIFITTVNRTVGAGGQRGGRAIPLSADGGSVPKDSGPYVDKHLYMLAPGEEIISNRHGQADRFRADRASGRIPGYADGGTTGDPKPPTEAQQRAAAKKAAARARARGRANRALGNLDVDLDVNAEGASDALAKFTDDVDHIRDLFKDAGFKWTKSLDTQTDAIRKSARTYDALNTSLTTARNDRASFAGDVGSSLGGSLFGNGLAGFDAATAANTADYTAARGGLATAIKNGLDGPLRDALAASGDINALTQFGNLSAADIQQRENQYAALQAAQSGFGNTAAAAKYDASIAAYSAELKKNTAAIERLEKRLPDAVRNGARDGSHSGTREGNKDRDTATTQAGRTGGRGGGHRGNGN